MPEEIDFSEVGRAIRETGWRIKPYGDSPLGKIGVYLYNLWNFPFGPKCLGRLPDTPETDRMVAGILRESFESASEVPRTAPREDFIWRAEAEIYSRLSSLVEGSGLPYMSEPEARASSRIGAIGLSRYRQHLL